MLYEVITLAVEDREQAFLIDLADVAGCAPAVHQSGSSRFGIADIFV